MSCVLCHGIGLVSGQLTDEQRARGMVHRSVRCPACQGEQTTAPGYWMNEMGGELRPAVEAYLQRQPLTVRQIALVRAYLRQWVNKGVWAGAEELEQLRRDVDGLTSRAAIDAWLERAMEEGIDPL